MIIKKDPHDPYVVGGNDSLGFSKERVVRKEVTAPPAVGASGKGGWLKGDLRTRRADREMPKGRSPTLEAPP